MDHFWDRKQGGEELGKILETLLGQEKAGIVLLAIPNGGPVVAEPIARVLRLPIEPIIAQRILDPRKNDSAASAVVEDQAVSGSPEQAKIRHRQKLYRDDRPLVSVIDRVAILVDDGVATGKTFLATLQFLRRFSPHMLIAAAPVWCQSTKTEIENSQYDGRPLVDQTVGVVVSNERNFFVSSHYDKFGNILDTEVVRILQRSGSLRS